MIINKYLYLFFHNLYTVTSLHYCHVIFELIFFCFNFFQFITVLIESCLHEQFYYYKEIDKFSEGLVSWHFVVIDSRKNRRFRRQKTGDILSLSPVRQPIKYFLAVNKFILKMYQKSLSTALCP